MRGGVGEGLGVMQRGSKTQEARNGWVSAGMPRDDLICPASVS